MSLTGFNIRRRREKAKAKVEKPVISEKVAEEKTEKADTSATKVVHKKTTKK